jgi:hypothetical protein
VHGQNWTIGFMYLGPQRVPSMRWLEPHIHFLSYTITSKMLHISISFHYNVPDF